MTSALKSVLPVGINPFWKLSFVFKCLTDSVVLDDFKTALDRLRAFKMSRLGSFAMDAGDDRSRKHKDAVSKANNWTTPPPVAADKAQPIGPLPVLPSPDGDYVKPRWEDLKAGHSDHVEKHDSLDPARNGSRDRDPEENPFDTVDANDYADPQREASDTRILESRTSWLHRRSSEETSDPDVEYAAALREVTNESMDHQRNKTRGIGVAD